MTTRGFERLQKATDEVLANPTKAMIDVTEKSGGMGRFTIDTLVWKHHEDFKSFVFASPAAQIARQLMGAKKKVNLLMDQLFVKEPGTTNETPWHQDHSFWPAQGWQICTIWMALDAILPETGGPEFVRGSHKWKRMFKAISPHQNPALINPDFEDVPDIEGNRDDYDIVGWDMQPGDVVAFHSMILHWAGANKSSTARRRAYAIRWSGDDVTFDPRKYTSPFLVSLGQASGLKRGDSLDCDSYPRVWSCTV